MLYVNITNLLRLSRTKNSPVGISRVIIELIRFLIRHSYEVGFVFYYKKTKKWYEVKGIDFRELTLKQFYQVFYSSKLYPKGFGYIRSSQKLGYKNFVLLLWDVLRDRFYSLFGLKRSDLRNIEISEFQGRSGDSIFHVGIEDGQAYRILKKHNPSLRHIFYLHDIIPLRRNYCFQKEFCVLFEKYFNFLVENASLIFVNSEYVKKDFLAYLNEINKSVLAEVVVTKLPAMKLDIPLEYSIFDLRDQVKRLTQYKYALFVGTQAQRKNVHYLLHIWDKYYHSSYYKGEYLVIAGGMWPECAYLKQFYLNPAFAGGSVMWIQNPTERELDYLYKQTKFSVHTSIEEGWGLPISESLAYGKPVIYLNSTSLPEAAFGTGLMIEKEDMFGFVRALDIYFHNLEKYQAEICKIENLNLFTWDDFGEIIYSQLRSLLNS